MPANTKATLLERLRYALAAFRRTRRLAVYPLGALALWLTPERIAARLHLTCAVRVDPYVLCARRADWAAIEEVWLRDEYSVVDGILKERDRPTIVDVGANIGAFSLRVFRTCPSAVIHAVEPSPETYRLLEQNRRANPGLAWHLYRAAIGPADGTVAFRINPQESLLGAISADGDARVLSVSLTTFLSDHVKGPVDLLKMDIEGGEEAALCGHEQALASVKTLLIEIHPDCCDAQRVLDSLKQSFAHLYEIPGHHFGNRLVLAGREAKALPGLGERSASLLSSAPVLGLPHATSASPLQHRSTPYTPTLFWLACILMTLAALHRLGNEFGRLLWETGPTGAVDLIQRHIEIQRWFAGLPVYSELVAATYPPASLVILWPLLGWLQIPAARWLWAATTVAALGWLVILSFRASLAETAPERLFIALLPLSMYATSAAIGNGQLLVYVLPALLASLLMLHTTRASWAADVGAAILFLLALVKPSTTIPFFWLLLLPGRPRPAILVMAGYLTLTLFALSFQGATAGTIFDGWQARVSTVVTTGKWGYLNLHIWLVRLGATQLASVASLLALLSLGWWTIHYRHADIWLRMAVIAIVARLWTYHQLYDDLLMLVPMLTLFRFAKMSHPDHGSGAAASALLALAWVAALAPARILSLSPPWNWLFEAGQTVTWISILAFLFVAARRRA